jgi:hypothetical protein
MRKSLLKLVTGIMGFSIMLGMLCSAAFADEKPAEGKTAPPEGVLTKAAFGKGFTWESPDKLQSLQICGRIKYLFQQDDYDLAKNRAGTPNEAGFGFGLAYLFLRGKVYTDKLTYLVNYRLDLATSPLADLKIMYKPPVKEAKLLLTIGKYKPPFSREYQLSSGALQLPGSSMADGQFKVGRNHGVTFKAADKKDLVAFELGVFDGGVTSDRFFSKIMRLELCPFGVVKKVQSDIKHSEKPLLSFGIAYAVDPNIADNDADGKNEDDDTRTTVDISVFFKGMSVDFALYNRMETNATTDSTTGLPANKKSSGWRIGGGCFILPKQVEVAALVSFIDKDEEYSHNWKIEKRVGLNWFIKGRNVLVQVDFGRLEERLAHGKYRDNQFRALLQLQF